MKPSAVKAELKAAEKSLADLRDELPQFQALLTDNEADAARLKSERANLDEIAQAKNRVLVAREMLEQHRADIAAAEHRVAELQAQSDREDALASIAEASVRVPEVRAELDALFAETDRVLVAAIERAKALADEGNERLRLARQTVKRLAGLNVYQAEGYARDLAPQEALFAEAVAGTDVAPLSTYTTELQPWPADYGSSPYRVLGHLNPHSANLRINAPETEPTADNSGFEAMRSEFLAGLTGSDA